MEYIIKDGELYHHGVKGQKWGVRRYQNSDGSLTEAGKKRLVKTLKKEQRKIRSRRAKLGDLVEKDDVVAEAAKKAIPIIKEHQVAYDNLYKFQDRLYKGPLKDRGVDVESEEALKYLSKKDKNEYFRLQEQVVASYEKEQTAIKQLVDSYLDNYGDTPITSGGRLAKDSLKAQIEWGVALGKLNHSDFDDPELYHHGVKGQKWGVRRYQNSDGSLTLLGKARAGYKDYKKKKTLEKARKAKQEKAAAAKKAKQEQEEFEAGKKKAIESGSAQDVLKYKGKLTQQELQTAFNRLNLERSIADINTRDNANRKSRIEKITDRLQKAKTLADKGIDAWNVTAKILNSITNSDLPVIDGNKKADKAIEKARKKLIESGTPEEIKKHFGKLSVKELEDINKRFNYEDNISKRIKTDNTPVESPETNRAAAAGKKYILKRYPWELNK